ncbi:Protein of uncharacterised function (DUF1176) [Legionella lansingensis]|uniref:DUF1176 domain-containing protein n=1 Tax=Legionella lansingensis TaxID=45067 RepID=A0A0W0VGR0_9GAMM|nr:DUF1176 domain-containing protein [Legionella lansingensis]KTD18825.1 hypothetical protein Llan_2428 [Legionella lansingensis]SNV43399.1 Protein of uncharacterised function (DUF1176) [Legionella lansingensis]
MKRKIVLLLSLLTTIGSFAQSSIRFADWIVGCDNQASCTVIGFPAKNGATSEGFIKMVRVGPPTTLPVVNVVVSNKVAKPGALLQLVFEPGSIIIKTKPLVQGEKNLKAGLSSQATKQFMDAVNESQFVTIKGDVTREIKISLMGAAGALTYMDDKQQPYKAVSEQALQNNQMLLSPSGTPTIPSQAKQMRILHGDLPPLPPALLQYRATTGACAGDDAPRAIVAILSEEETLWGLCKSVTGNNVDYAFFMVKNDQAQAASFAVPPGEPDLHGVLTNPDISNEDRILSSFMMTRSEGDCGILGEWTWDGENFNLFRYRKMTDCRGLFDTDDWPTLYRAK